MPSPSVAVAACYIENNGINAEVNLSECGVRVAQYHHKSALAITAATAFSNTHTHTHMHV